MINEPHGDECSCASCTDARMFNVIDHGDGCLVRWSATEHGPHKTRTTVNALGGKAIGVGATEAEAIADLKAKIRKARA